MKLRGTRVLLDQPKINDLGLELSPEVERELMADELKKFSALTVYAVGDEVIDIEPGDTVYVSPSTLAMTEVLEIDGEPRMLVRAMDISIVW
jgi:hypothetical protein